MQSHAAGVDQARGLELSITTRLNAVARCKGGQAGGLELSITTRPNAVARSRGYPGWRVNIKDKLNNGPIEHLPFEQCHLCN